jgi:glycogen(starch) synthase
MLVDNGVEGDSRVQKEARSAAAAGWDVILLGVHVRGSTRKSWTIGKAEVRLVPIPSAGFADRTVTNRRSLRRPLAYPSEQAARYRAARVRTTHVQVVTGLGELAEARRATGSTWRRATGHLALLPSRVRLKILRPWFQLRSAETDRLRAAQRDSNNRLTRLHIRCWTAISGRRVWRRLEPGLWDWELALGPVVDRLKPDIIHANDCRMLGIGARAKMRAALRGRSLKLVWDAHEYLPGMRELPGNPRWQPALVAFEKEYCRFSDAVLTVSPALADLLVAEHGLETVPAVLLNTPDDPAAEHADDSVPDLRERCGIGPDTPLLAYCGGINNVRGLDLVVDALPALPGVHVALVSLHPNGNRRSANEIELRARELGVADRIHLLPYMPHWQVVPFLSGADAALSPLRHLPNHEIALSNKFFEYSQARLPLVVSDVKVMAEMVRSTGQGEVFTADDVPDFCRAVRAVLADPARYRAAYDRPGLLEEWTWERQAAVLDRVYTEVLSSPPIASS